MHNVPRAKLYGQADRRQHSVVCACALCSPQETQNIPSDTLTTVPLMTGWDNFRFFFDSWYFKIVCHSNYDFCRRPRWRMGWGGFNPTFQPLHVSPQSSVLRRFLNNCSSFPSLSTWGIQLSLDKTSVGALRQDTQSRTSTELATYWEIRLTKFYFSGLSTLWQLRGLGLLIRWGSLVLKSLDSWGSGIGWSLKSHVKIADKTSMKATSPFSLFLKERLCVREKLKKPSRFPACSALLCNPGLMCLVSAYYGQDYVLIDWEGLWLESEMSPAGEIYQVWEKASRCFSYRSLWTIFISQPSSS